jgi:hypothetical protein
MAQSHRQSGSIGRFVRWFAGSPFEHLPAAYGDTVPADLQAFEADMAEEAHKTRYEPAHQAAPVRLQSMSVHSRSDLERQ